MSVSLRRQHALIAQRPPWPLALPHDYNTHTRQSNTRHHHTMHTGIQYSASTAKLSVSVCLCVCLSVSLSVSVCLSISRMCCVRVFAPLLSSGDLFLPDSRQVGRSALEQIQIEPVALGIGHHCTVRHRINLYATHIPTSTHHHTTHRMQTKDDGKKHQRRDRVAIKLSSVEDQLLNLEAEQTEEVSAAFNHSKLGLV